MRFLAQVRGLFCDVVFNESPFLVLTMLRNLEKSKYGQVNETKQPKTDLVIFHIQTVSRQKVVLALQCLWVEFMMCGGASVVPLVSIAIF